MRFNTQYSCCSLSGKSAGKLRQDRGIGVKPNSRKSLT